MAGRIVVLEGRGAAGKTTLLRRLSAAGMAGVPDVADWPEPLSRPPRPNTREEFLRNQDWWLEFETVRWVRACKLQAAGRDVVVDGSPLRSLTYAWAYPHLFAPRWAVFDELAPRYLEALAAGRLGVGNRVLHLQVSRALAAARMAGDRSRRRGSFAANAPVDDLLEPLFTLGLAPGLPGCWLFIDAKGTPDEVYRAALATFDEPLPSAVDQVAVVGEFVRHVKQIK